MNSILFKPNLTLKNHYLVVVVFQIAAVKAQGKSVPSSLLQKVEDSQEQIREAQAILKQGGETALNYMKQLKAGMEIEKAKAQKCLQTGDKVSLFDS